MGEVQLLSVNMSKSMSNERPKTACNSAGGDPSASALADTAANTCAVQTLRVMFWGWFLQTLKARSAAEEGAGRAQLAVTAAGKFHAFDGVVLHFCRFDGREPLENNVWHLSLETAFSSDGVLAMQFPPYDLQPFSYQIVTFPKASSQPGTLAKKMADLCAQSRPPAPLMVSNWMFDRVSMFPDTDRFLSLNCIFLTTGCFVLLFPCNFCRGVQFVFWRSMHTRVRLSSMPWSSPSKPPPGSQSVAPGVLCVASCTPGATLVEDWQGIAPAAQ